MEYVTYFKLIPKDQLNLNLYVHQPSLLFRLDDPFQGLKAS